MTDYQKHPNIFGSYTYQGKWGKYRDNRVGFGWKIQWSQWVHIHSRRDITKYEGNN